MLYTIDPQPLTGLRVTKILGRAEDKFFDILETKRKLKLRLFVPYFALSSRADVKKEQKLKKQQNLHVAY